MRQDLRTPPDDMPNPGPAQKRPEVEIFVNNKAVLVSGHHVTGLTIKEAAIAFGVEIELDFQLAEIKEKKRTIIGDDDVVHVERSSRFIATAPDDNS